MTPGAAGGRSDGDRARRTCEDVPHMETYVMTISAVPADGADPGPLTGTVEHQSTGATGYVSSTSELMSFLRATAEGRSALIVARMGRAGLSDD